jgi:hypothetical protein
MIYPNPSYHISTLSSNALSEIQRLKIILERHSYIRFLNGTLKKAFCVIGPDSYLSNDVPTSANFADTT